jgi:hypothetical protein
MMRPLIPLLLLAACQDPPRLPPEAPASLPAFCRTTATLPRPPNDERSLPQLIAWARTAARVANAAIAERDACALDYAQLRTACATEKGCIVPYRGGTR